MAYIKVENLKYRYPNTKKLALDDLNFEIEKAPLSELQERTGLERVRSVRHLTDWCQVSSKEHMADA